MKPLLLLLSATPFISSEIDVTRQPPEPWSGTQSAVASDFDGQHHVIFWWDGRTLLPSLVATRVAPDGALVDPVGVVVLNGVAVQDFFPTRTPSVAFDGNVHVVTINKHVAGVESPFVLRVDGNLRALDAAPRPLPGRIGTHAAGVAFDGSNFALAYQDHSVGCVLAWMAPDGTFPRTSVTVSNQECEVVASAQTTALVAGAAGYRRMTSTGQPVDASWVPFPFAASPTTSPAVASSGTQFLVAWTRYVTTPSPTMQVEAIRVPATGAPLDGAPIVLASAPYSSGDISGAPSAVWTGSEWHVVWPGGGVRLSPAGQVTGRLSAFAGFSKPSLTWAGQSGMVAARSSFLVEAQGTTASLQLANATPLTVSNAAPRQLGPAISSDGQTALVVFSDYGSSTSTDQGVRLRAGRVTADGRALDGPGITLDTTLSYGAQTLSSEEFRGTVRASWTGQHHLVVWAREEMRGNFTTAFLRVAPSGAFLDAGPRALPLEAAAYPRYGLASLPSGVSLACVPVAAGRVDCVRLDSAGTVLGTTSLPKRAFSVSVGTVGGNFAVAFDELPLTGSKGTVWFSTVDPVTGASSAPVSVAQNANAWGIAVGSGATEAAVAWVEPTLAGRPAAVMMRTATVAGQLSSPRTLSGPGTLPFISASTSGEWLVTWTIPSALMAQRFTSTGPVDAEAFQLHPGFTAGSGELGYAQAATAPLGTGWLSASPQFDERPGVSNTRLKARLVNAGQAGGTSCGAGEQCGSGVCLEGVCCASYCETACVAPSGECLPPDGGVDGGTSDAGVPDSGLTLGEPPRVTSTPYRAATCGVPWEYLATAEGDGPISFSLRQRPEGMLVESGLVTWTPDTRTAGAFEVELVAASSAGADSQRFTLEVACERVRLTDEGCGCGSSGGLTPALGLALLAWRARRRWKSPLCAGGDA